MTDCCFFLFSSGKITSALFILICSKNHNQLSTVKFFSANAMLVIILGFATIMFVGIRWIHDILRFHALQDSLQFPPISDPWSHDYQRVQKSLTYIKMNELRKFKQNKLHNRFIYSLELIYFFNASKREEKGVFAVKHAEVLKTWRASLLFTFWLFRLGYVSLFGSMSKQNYKKEILPFSCSVLPSHILS